MARALISSSTITGEVKTYAGAAAPAGFLLCQGQAVSRATYADLYAILGASHGSGDGLTTFNLPDYRGSFLRGLVNVTTVAGSGTASGTATFTAHGLNRTGFKVRLSSGTLSGLAGGVDYYVMVADANTLRFCTTKANALAGTFIAVSGANTAVIVQWEDPDYASRQKLTGGANATGLGGFQDDALQNITGSITNIQSDVDSFMAFSGAFQGVSMNPNGNSSAGGADGYNATFDASLVARTSIETRPKNVLINYIIKY